MKTKVMRVPEPLVEAFRQQIQEFHQRLQPHAEKVVVEMSQEKQAA